MAADGKANPAAANENTPLVGADAPGKGSGSQTLSFVRTVVLPPLLVYGIGVGALCYLEGWPFLLSNYVVAQIITTVGYGDFTVEQTSAKVFMAFYAIVVIVVLAYYHSLAIGDLVQWECDTLRKYLRKFEVQANEHVHTDAAAEKRYAVINQAIASLVIFLPVLAFGTIYYRLEEHCSCSYGLSRVEGCDPTSFSTCVATNGFQKDWASAFYMSAITLTTIGFGDFQPRTVLGRIFGIVWMIIGTVCTATCLGSWSTWFFTSTKEEDHKTKDMTQGIDAETFAKMDKDHNGSLTRGEFLAYTLVKYNLVSQELMDEVNHQFDLLDPKGTNAVTLDAITMMSQRRQDTRLPREHSAPI